MPDSMISPDTGSSLNVSGNNIAMVAMYATAMFGMVILVGLSGQVSLGNGALMAVGGYTFALVSMNWQSVPLLGVPMNGWWAMVFAALGGIVLSFSLAPRTIFGQGGAPLPGSLQTNRMLDAWLRINADGCQHLGNGCSDLTVPRKTILRERELQFEAVGITGIGQKFFGGGHIITTRRQALVKSENRRSDELVDRLTQPLHRDFR